METFLPHFRFRSFLLVWLFLYKFFLFAFLILFPYGCNFSRFSLLLLYFTPFFYINFYFFLLLVVYIISLIYTALSKSVFYALFFSLYVIV